MCTFDKLKVKKVYLRKENAMTAPEFIALFAFIRIIAPFGLILLLGELTKRQNTMHQPEM